MVFRSALLSASKRMAMVASSQVRDKKHVIDIVVGIPIGSQWVMILLYLCR
jgi:hypothetical protein